MNDKIFGLTLQEWWDAPLDTIIYYLQKTSPARKGATLSRAQVRQVRVSCSKVGHR